MRLNLAGIKIARHIFCLGKFFAIYDILYLRYIFAKKIAHPSFLDVGWEALFSLPGSSGENASRQDEIDRETRNCLLDPALIYISKMNKIPIISPFLQAE